MDLPSVTARIKTLEECGALAAENRIKHAMGHTHKNNFNKTDPTSGLIVAGMGMEGSGDYGVPVIDTTEDRFRIYYFPIAFGGQTERAFEKLRNLSAEGLRDKEEIDKRYNDIIGCVEKNGWRACLHLAEVWLDEELEERRADGNQVYV